MAHSAHTSQVPPPASAVAFDDALYLKIRKQAARLARSHGLDVHELTQVVSLRLVRSGLLSKWQADRSPIDAFLYVITRSEAMSLRRTARRRAAIGARFEADEAARHRDQMRAAALRAVGSAQGSRLRQLTARLSPEGARVVARLLEGATQLELRREMGVKTFNAAWREVQHTAGGAL